jgi:hypothetical protein
MNDEFLVVGLFSPIPKAFGTPKGDSGAWHAGLQFTFDCSTIGLFDYWTVRLLLAPFRGLGVFGTFRPFDFSTVGLFKTFQDFWTFISPL